MSKTKLLSSIPPLIKPPDNNNLLLNLAGLPHHSEFEILTRLPSKNKECSMLGGFEITPEQLDEISGLIPKIENPTYLMNELQNAWTVQFQGGDDDSSIL